MIINILSQDILPIPKSYSEELKKLVELLLKKDPNMRPSIEEILEFEYVAEKMNQFNFNFSPKSESSSSPHHPSTNNTTSNTITLLNNLNSLNSLNNNTNSTNVSSNFNSINNYSSPVHIESEANANLFNLGFGNLLNEINEVDEEHNVNSISMSPKALQSDTPKKIVVQRSHKKYSPSYAVGDMNEIMKHLNIPIHNGNIEEIMEDEERKWEENVIVLENEGGLSKYSKNQFSVPELNKKVMLSVDSPEKLSMEESKK